MAHSHRELTGVSFDPATAAVMQEALRRQGLYEGAADSIFGRKTATALQQHLVAIGHDIEVDGVAGNATITALQTELKRRGFYDGKIDGVAGEITKRAIHAYFSIPADAAHIDLRSPDAFSDQVRLVREIAAQNGDTNFLMVDKINGKIMLFQDGRLVLRAAALTGANLEDVIPASAYSKTVDEQGFDEKVTPAGRFTVHREHDTDYGDVLTLNEIRGDSWSIAIHQVYTGTPSERRPERLRSGRGSESHISFGCINVAKETIAELLRHVPGKDKPDAEKMPLYILPQNLERTLEFFPVRAVPRELTQ